MLPFQPGHCLMVFATLCFSFYAVLGFAQKPADPAPAIKFGKITPDQFAYPSTDTTAEAEVIYAYGEVNFELSSGTIRMSFTHHVRTKIRKKSAYDRATIELQVRNSAAGQDETVAKFEGYTYNLTNGTVTIDELGKTGHFTEKVSDNVSLEKYTLPNVHEGSIIEYRYTVLTPFSVSSSPRTWRFQQDIPVNWSEYRIMIPDYFYYKMMLGGYLNLAINEHKPSNISLFPGKPISGAVDYRFAVKNAPAFRNEAYITTTEDYIAKIDFELASYQFPDGFRKNLSVGWDMMDQTLLEHPNFGEQLKRNGFLRETAATLNSQQADTLARITAAYEFIRKTIKWTNEASLMSYRGIKKVFDDKKGNAADINLLLIALLREMDIDANPVILSTRSHGRIDETYALLRKFNYVIAQVEVGGKDLLLDATDEFLKAGMLPSYCLNGTGRLVHPSKSRFLLLTPTEHDGDVHTYTLTLNEEGSLSGTLTHSLSGYGAWRARKSMATEGKTNYLEGIQKKHTAWQIEKAEFTGLDIKSSAFNADYTLTIPDACGRAGDRFYFRPMLTEAHTANLFKETERLFPVDFGVLTDETFTATYTLPPGFQVEEMPKPISMSLPNNGGRFIYQLMVGADNKLQVLSRILLRRSIYYADEYPVLRELFNRIVAKHAEQVVLKRGTVADKK